MLFACFGVSIDAFLSFSYSYSALAVLVLEDTASSTSTSTIKAKTAALPRLLAGEEDGGWGGWVKKRSRNRFGVLLVSGRFKDRTAHRKCGWVLLSLIDSKDE